MFLMVDVRGAFLDSEIVLTSFLPKHHDPTTEYQYFYMIFGNQKRVTYKNIKSLLTDMFSCFLAKYSTSFLSEPITYWMGASVLFWNNYILDAETIGFEMPSKAQFTL